MDDIIKLFRQARHDYDYKEDIFDTGSEKVRLVKRIVSRLPQVDRTIIVLYAECQSYRKMGRALGLSHVTIGKEVVRIRREIQAEYERLQEQQKRTRNEK